MKIFLCIPSGDYAQMNFMSSVMDMGNHTISIPNSTLHRVNIQSSNITYNRNKMTDYALRNGADWLLFIDSDMVFPPYTLDRLLSHNKDIIGIVARKRSYPFESIGTLIKSEDIGSTESLLQMSRIGAGVLLIRAEVFKKITLPWWRNQYEDGILEEMGEDIYFCEKAKEAGYEIWADMLLSSQIGHMGVNTVTHIPSDDMKSGGPLPWFGVPDILLPDK